MPPRPAKKAAPSSEPALAPAPKTTPKPPKISSPAERIRALEAEIQRIRMEEHDSRYNLITSAIAELNAMGYPYRLVDDGKGKAGAKATTKAAAPVAVNGAAPDLSAHYDEKKYCKLCRENGHDAKAHTRAGEFKERAFTNEEKARRGVLPPELHESFLAEQGAAADQK